MHIPKLGGYMGGNGSLSEKLTMLSLALNPDPEIRAKIPELMLAQREKAERDAATTELDGIFAPHPGVPTAPPMPRGALPGDESAGPPTIPMKPAAGAPAAFPSLHDQSTVAALLKARRAKVDISPYVDMIRGAEKGPTYVEGPDGIYERGEQGWRRAQAYPEKPPAIPFGWEMGPDNTPHPKRGGPADPAYIAQTAGVRREAIVSRPTPSRARPRAAAAGAPIAPKGPWERSW